MNELSLILDLFALLAFIFAVVVAVYGLKIYMETRQKIPEVKGRKIYHISLKEFWKKSKGKSPIFVDEEMMK